MKPSRPERFDVPRHSIADVQRLVAMQVSLPSRVGHVLLLIGSLMMAATISSLWATEPSLPVRTHLAFAVIVSAAAAWAIFAMWVLTRRRVLFGADRVWAARLGLACSTVGAVGMAGLGYWAGLGRGAYVGAVMHVGFCGIAMVLLVRARQRVAMLLRRRRELEARLASRRES